LRALRVLEGGTLLLSLAALAYGCLQLSLDTVASRATG
jgi:hypothetical protein